MYLNFKVYNECGTPSAKIYIQYPVAAWFYLYGKYQEKYMNMYVCMFAKNLKKIFTAYFQLENTQIYISYIKYSYIKDY